ncbi:MAG: hypothetical protein V1775_02470 [Bacteroidota bacterium]
MLSGCCKKDKDEDNPDAQVPLFNVTANTVQLQGGGEGLQFFAKCTNEDVNVTKVTNTSPISVQSFTYELNGNSIAKNTEFSLQDEDVGFLKEPGTWSFTFEGKRTSENESFSVNATLLITSK